MKYKVLALKEMDPLGHKILEQIGAEALTAPETASEEEILDLIAKNQVDAIYSRTDKVDRAMMDASPRLKVVAKQGVGLDVFEQEPLPLSSELFTMENVVLTPPTRRPAPTRASGTAPIWPARAWWTPCWDTSASPTRQTGSEPGVFETKKLKSVTIGGPAPTMVTPTGKFCGKLCARSKATSARFPAKFCREGFQKGELDGQAKPCRTGPPFAACRVSRHAEEPCTEHSFCAGLLLFTDYSSILPNISKSSPSWMRSVRAGAWGRACGSRGASANSRAGTWEGRGPRRS